MGLITILGILGICIAVHEWGHFYEMTKKGIYPAEFAVGLPIPLITIKFRMPKKYPGTVFKISPLLVGGYIKPTHEQTNFIESLPINEHSKILGAGIVNNILLTFFGVYFLVITLGEASVLKALYLFLIVLLICWLIWLFRTFISKWIILPIGLLFIILLIQSFMTSPSETVGGPITIYDMSGSFQQLNVGDEVVQTSSLIQAIVFTCVISISLAVFNALPFVPLDGGRIAVAWMKHLHVSVKIVNIFTTFGTLIVFGLILFAIIGDFLKALF